MCLVAWIPDRICSFLAYPVNQLESIMYAVTLVVGVTLTPALSVVYGFIIPFLFINSCHKWIASVTIQAIFCTAFIITSIVVWAL